MPRDMAVKGPYAGIDGIVLCDDIPVWLQQLHVAPLRVAAVHDTAVPGADAFVQHVHVVAMQMHRVRRRGVVLDDETHRGRAAGVVNAPFRVVGVGCVPDVGEQEDRRVVVCAEGNVVDDPYDMTRTVDLDADREGGGVGRIGGGTDGVDRGGGG